MGSSDEFPGSETEGRVFIEVPIPEGSSRDDSIAKTRSVLAEVQDRIHNMLGIDREEFVLGKLGNNTDWGFRSQNPLSVIKKSAIVNALEKEKISFQLIPETQEV